MPAPRVSVILATHNNDQHLDVAICSVLNQTLTDFEFLIVDDGSTDRSAEILATHAATDTRIRLFRNETNLGLVPSLNRLLDTAEGEFIARMDGDDIAHPRRLERQVEFMTANGIDACGTWTRSFGTSRPRIVRFPVSDTEIRARMLFESPFCHPAMVFRRSLFANGLRYRENAAHAEDFDLFARLPTEALLANVPEVLLQYRMHSGQVSIKKALDQGKTSAQVRKEYLQRLGVPATDEEAEIHVIARSRRAPASELEINAIETWLRKLAEFFSDQPVFLHTIGKQWFLVAVRSSAQGMRAREKYMNSPLHDLYRPTRAQRVQLLSLCLTRIRYRSPLYNFLEQFSG